jgi:putative spermidine/putrescine transport system ATP-binding protein
LRAEILRIRRETGVAMICVTHDLAEAMALGNRVAVMNQGRIEQIGTPQEIRTRPASAFVSEFLGSILEVT